VLYALDPATGDELYTSGDSMDSWNHYGGIALSDGNVYVTSYQGVRLWFEKVTSSPPTL